MYAQSCERERERESKGRVRRGGGRWRWEKRSEVGKEEGMKRGREGEKEIKREEERREEKEEEYMRWKGGKRRGKEIDKKGRKGIREERGGGRIWEGFKFTSHE